MMDAAEGRLRAMGCPKINLQVSRSNTQAVDFYLSIGFVEDATISMGKRVGESGPQMSRAAVLEALARRLSYNSWANSLVLGVVRSDRCGLRWSAVPG